MTTTNLMMIMKKKKTPPHASAMIFDSFRQASINCRLASRRSKKSSSMSSILFNFYTSSLLSRYKNGTRSSLTFSNQRMEEIQRENKHLLDKIMRNGPAGDGYSSRKQGSNKASLKRFFNRAKLKYFFYRQIEHHCQHQLKSIDARSSKKSSMRI